MIDGAALRVKIVRGAFNFFFIKAEAEGVDLGGVVNPIQVVLTIGRDSGSTKVQAVFEDD